MTSRRGSAADGIGLQRPQGLEQGNGRLRPKRFRLANPSGDRTIRSSDSEATVRQLQTGPEQVHRFSLAPAASQSLASKRKALVGSFPTWLVRATSRHPVWSAPARRAASRRVTCSTPRPVGRAPAAFEADGRSIAKPRGQIVQLGVGSGRRYAHVAGCWSGSGTEKEPTAWESGVAPPAVAWLQGEQACWSASKVEGPCRGPQANWRRFTGLEKLSKPPEAVPGSGHRSPWRAPAPKAGLLTHDQLRGCSNRSRALQYKPFLWRCHVRGTPAPSG